VATEGVVIPTVWRAGDRCVVYGRAHTIRAVFDDSSTVHVVDDSGFLVEANVEDLDLVPLADRGEGL
jgi:hypothetical protein